MSTVVLMSRKPYDAWGMFYVHPEALEIMDISAPKWVVSSSEPYIDREDSAEHYARARALHSLGYDVVMFNLVEREFYRLGDPNPITVSDDTPVMWGIPRSIDMFFPNEAGQIVHGRKMARFLDREVVLFDYVDDDDTVGKRVDSEEEVKFGELCLGQSRFVKTMSKGFSRVVDFPGGNAPNSATLTILKHMELYQLPALSVQEVVCPTWETRFFVVDRKVVASSGRSVSSFPRFVSGDDGSVGMERFSVGAPGETLEHNPYYDKQYDLACQFASAAPADSYVVDIAIHGSGKRQGEPFVVETNSLRSSGLYRCDVMALADAYACSALKQPTITVGDVLKVDFMLS